MPESEGPLPQFPQARNVPRRRTRPSLVWLIPIVAALAGAWVAVTRILEQGPPEQLLGHPHHERTRRFLERVVDSRRVDPVD